MTPDAMKKLATLSLIAAALAVSACNTISGIGRDVRAAGDAVTSGAESARR
jgi:entericidin B